MDAPLPKGTIVRHTAPIVRGTVVDIKFDADKLAFEYLVNFKGTDGEEHQRWFFQADMEEDKPIEAPDAPATEGSAA